MSEYLIGIDVGGTFTDGVVIDLGDGRVHSGKSPTTYPDPLRGVLDVLANLAAEVGRDQRALLEDTVKLVHGTTLTSNVMFERTGARVALLATQGFGDAILMMSGKGRVAGLSLMERRHFRATDKPVPIVPRRRIVEVAERIDSDGDVVVALGDETVAATLDALADIEPDAVAVSFLWSLRNADHEHRMADAVRDRLPGVHVTCSSDLAPVLGEYERTATAVVNAYVGPAVRDYLDTVERSLGWAGLRAPLLVLQSSGGVAAASRTDPVRTIESGPAAGVRGSLTLMEQVGYDNAIVTDVGGTTFKVTIIRDREPTLATETVLNQYSLLVPMVDVVSIGAGGGSIAWVDGERLRVGPTSAGSDPGPACYGRGGGDPTVTDADVVLGFINPEYFLGGSMGLDAAAAAAAIEDKVAGRLFGGDVIAAASGIRRIVDAQMGDLIHKASVERGHDPRDFAVLAFGGAGPVHCGAYAAELGCQSIVVPPNATVYSAYGGAASDLQQTLQVSRPQPAPGSITAIAPELEELRSRATGALDPTGQQADRVRVGFWTTMRYRRQFHEVRLPLGVGGRVAQEDLDAAVARFQADYARLYGEGAGHGEERVEFVRFGIDATLPTLQARPSPEPEGGADPAGALKGERAVHWTPDGPEQTPIYAGPGLRPGNVVAGPAILEHPGTSIVVHHGQTARVDGFLNTIIDLGSRDAATRRGLHL